MSRTRAILQSQFPYNISGRCINREWFQIPMPSVWDIFCYELTETANKLDLLIHSFLLMSNHFHLIASTPQANISECTHRFIGRTSRQLTREGNRINQTFAGRHFKCILLTQNSYLNAYKYNYRNPVTAGICKRVEDYPYSTLRGLLNTSELKVPLREDFTFSADSSGTLAWLNTAPDPSKLEGVRWGLKRQYFKTKKSRKNGRPLIEDHEVL